MLDELLDVQDVATLLKVNPRTVLRMTERGDLAAVKVARRWRFRQSDLNEYLQSQVDEKQSGESKELSVRHSLSLPSQFTGDYHSGALKEDTGRRELPIEATRQLLEIEKQRLELQRDLLELETKRIDYAFTTANKMVSAIQPEGDAEKKSQLFQDILKDLLNRLDSASPTI